MKYTDYFSHTLRENGTPKLSAEGFKRYMNIVYAEGELNGIGFSKNRLRETAYFHTLDIKKFNISKRLSDLTGNLEPEELLYKIVNNKPI